MFTRIFFLSGLIAGEMLGPIQLKHDYFNVDYYDVIYQNYEVNIHSLLKNIGIRNFIHYEYLKKSYDYIYENIKERRNFVEDIKHSSKPHLYYYLDLIELGFRKFYGSQMHLIRYYAENIPVFYDLDILELILNTNFHYIFKKSFKNLFYRWRSRAPQSFITSNNYPEIAQLPLDRGFTPADLMHPIKRYFTFYPYLKRKKNLKKMPPDFQSEIWCTNLLNEKFVSKIVDANIFNIGEIKTYIQHVNISKEYYSIEANKLISHYIFSHLI